MFAYTLHFKALRKLAIVKTIGYFYNTLKAQLFYGTLIDDNN